MKKLVYPFLFGLLLAGAAQAQEAAKLAQRLVERSGVAVQLQSLPKNFEEHTAALRGVPSELVLALTEAGREAYRPQRMAQEIADTLAATLKPEEMERVLAWLEADLGRRVTLAEERASASHGRGKPRALCRGDQGQAAGRAAPAADPGHDRGDGQPGAGREADRRHGARRGDRHRQHPAAQNRAGAAALRKQIEAAMPKERVKAQLREAMPVMTGYTYREVSDADLAAYVAFLRSADGKRANDAITDAFSQAMVSASLRLGQLVDQRVAKRPT